MCWVFVSVWGLSLVAASGGHSSSRCAGLSLSRPLLLRCTGSRRAGSVVVAHGPSCSTACGIFPDQGSNPCPLHWQADSQPLRHWGSPGYFNISFSFVLLICNWQIKLYIFKMYSVVIWHMYTLWNDYRNKANTSITSFSDHFVCVWWERLSSTLSKF